MSNWLLMFNVLTFEQKRLAMIIAMIVVALLALLFIAFLVKNVISARKENESLPSLSDLGFESEDEVEDEVVDDSESVFVLGDDLDESDEADVFLQEVRKADKKKSVNFFNKNKKN